MPRALRHLLVFAILATAPVPLAAVKPVSAALMCLRTSQFPKDLADAVAAAGLTIPDRLSPGNARRIDDIVAACDPDPARRDDYARYLRAMLSSMAEAVAMEAEGIPPGLVDDILEARRAELMKRADPSEDLLDAVSDGLARSRVKVASISDEGWYQLGAYIASQSALLSTEAKLRR